MDEYEVGQIEVGATTVHVLLEANLQLQARTREHFSPRKAHILMESLTDYQNVEAREFYDSLNNS